MSDLQQFIKKLTEKFKNITLRTTYGLNSLYVQENVYIVITNDDRIALKIIDYETVVKIKKIDGIENWILNNKEMKDWYLLPTTFNKKKNRLAPILEMTYKALLNPKKKKNSNNKKRKKKNKIIEANSICSSTKDSPNLSIFNRLIQKFVQKSK